MCRGRLARQADGPTAALTFVTRQLDRVNWEAREQGSQRTRVFNSFRDTPTDVYAASYNADGGR